ncbi:sulfatase [Natronococcus sp. A-GB1]|uniref:sulfatase family protein n=1 Tax=Natronococcus sp. A-GB1 TaxID=3037648 RepID=UPI00241C7BB8|nr:sulfatase [Natronococcus sp. A-GB1]MDG5760674.1 sulfatase [Natronococcus sp. A-GB1]
MAPPNIVLMHCHDLGRYLGCYGAAVDTPRIDGLAEEGVRFDRHFVTAPQCSPSRSSLMTGRHPHQNGMLGLAHGDWEIGPDERLLPRLLGEAGYETHRFGLQHITEYPDRLGYDHEHVEESLRVNTPPSVHETARARDVGEEVASVLSAGEHDDPFFASVGFFELHRVEEEDRFGFEADRYETPDPERVEPLPFLPDQPGIRSDIAEVQGMLGALDDGVGTVLDALEEAGLAEDTLVVFTTEHGLAFPRAKGCCYDAGIGAALAMRYPDGFEPSVVDDLVSNVDVFSTLLEFADVEVPANVAGRSFRNRLVDEGEDEYQPRERLFAGMTWHDRYNPVRAVRTDRYKYVRNFWHLPGVYLTRDIYESAAGSEVREEYYCEQRPYVELYDLETDPHEQENLAEDSDHEDVRDSLRDELIGWMIETDDPLLEGPVRPSDWDAIHPQIESEPEQDGP